MKKSGSCPRTFFLTLTLFATIALALTPAAAMAEEAASPLETPSPLLMQPALSLGYNLYASGLNVVETTVNFDLTDKDYTITANTNTRGLWKNIVPWSNAITARGTNSPDGIHPHTARYNTMWKNKPKTVEMTFAPDGSITTEWTPPNRKDDRDEATPEQLKGAMDPLSAVAAVLAKGESHGCKGKIPAFDGRRLYNLVFNNRGIEHLDHNRYSIFEGDATRCEITFEPVAGFPKKEKRRGFWNAEDNAEKRNPLIIWLADNVQPDLPTLPVRVQSTTQLGTLVAHLKQIEKKGTLQHPDHK